MSCSHIANTLEKCDIDELRELVKPYLTEKRYLHTLSVADVAKKIGGIYLSERVYELEAAALLHDITKKADLEKQLQYCELFGIINNTQQNISPEVLHSRTGAEVAKRDFAQYVNEDIVNAIRYHTTARENMTVFEAIVYLADYIEPTRTHRACIETREHFFNRIEAGDCAIQVLNETMLNVLDSTLKYLTDNNAVVDSETLKARDYYYMIVNKASKLKCEDNNE